MTANFIPFTIDKAQIQWEKLSDLAIGLSHADITRACEDAIKDAVIHDRDGLTSKDIMKPLSERKAIRNK